VIIEWYNKAFKSKIPPVFMEFSSNDGKIVFSDPEMVNEIYTIKNKYFDKHQKSKDLLGAIFGDSIIFARNDELWASKRKHLSVAFYKEKLTSMLQIMIIETLKYTKSWDNKTEPINIYKEVATLVGVCVSACIFG
jgi:cytochrome P450